MTKKIIIASDLHVPYHDVRAVQLWLQVCNAIGPDIVVINGDLYDFHGISQYDRDPDRRTKLKDEIQTGHAILAMVQAGEKHLILGNHEDRLRKYLWRYEF